MSSMNIEDLEITVTRKKIKNMYLRVLPPDGSISVSAPHLASEKAIRQFVQRKLPWIREKQQQVRSRKRTEPYQLINGETHYIWGRAYRLLIVEKGKCYKIELAADEIIFQVRRGSTVEQRKAHYLAWCREQLEIKAAELSAQWMQTMEVEAREIRTKNMKTKWGTCNCRERRIWLNLQLVRWPESCLNYILVHELAHLIERGHNKRFYALLDHYLPEWRVQRNILKSADCSQLI